MPGYYKVFEPSYGHKNKEIFDAEEDYFLIFRTRTTQLQYANEDFIHEVGPTKPRMVNEIMRDGAVAYYGHFGQWRNAFEDENINLAHSPTLNFTKVLHSNL